MLARAERAATAEDQWGTTAPSIELIAQLGEDLVITMSGTIDVFDTAESFADEFRDLPGLLGTLDLDDAHLASGCSIPRTGKAQTLEWMWATRFDGADDHASRGAVRVQGDAVDYAQGLLDGAADADTAIVVRRAEPDGDLIVVTLSHDPTEGPAGWDDVRHVHATTAYSTGAGPGVPIATG
ncbi:hypothetical protein [Brachybacterium fresconis]|uniref:Uncharacterized protein n=1 Tax=Brachybacterium fresconis TaxID=173363 RepID=A0ABS4YNR3_9MICO|nr:hypothetical protein [Brachybacterium fresconis]MBP2410369.1 hypothetical protein [Brachybacterium fresconis]